MKKDQEWNAAIKLAKEAEKEAKKEARKKKEAYT